MNVPSILVGQRLLLQGHFSVPILVEAVKLVGDVVAVQVRADDGLIHETFLTLEEIDQLLQQIGSPTHPSTRWGHPEELRLLIESRRTAACDESTEGVTMVKQVKVIVEKHLDGYVAYPLGLKGVVVGKGDTYEEALADVKSAIAFHIETFGAEVFEDESPVVEVFIAEAGISL